MSALSFEPIAPTWYLNSMECWQTSLDARRFTSDCHQPVPAVHPKHQALAPKHCDEVSLPGGCIAVWERGQSWPEQTVYHFMYILHRSDHERVIELVNNRPARSLPACLLLAKSTVVEGNIRPDQVRRLRLLHHA